MWRRPRHREGAGPADETRITTGDQTTGGLVHSLCHAPFTSLHLDPSGHVRVCELNSIGMLGRIPESRLVDLWHGERIARVRSALRADDLSVGCEDCRAPLESGERELAHAAYYDRFALPPTEQPEWPRQLELSLSNVCNLQCVMCNGDLSSSIRAQREGLPPLPKVYDDQFFDDLALFLPHLERVAFIGGEPFLGPESLRVFDMLTALERSPEVNVTSNGNVLTPRVRRIFEALPIELSVSMDAATAETYAAIRVGGDFARVIANLDEFAELATSMSLSYCLMVQNWHEFGAMLRLGTDRGVYVHVNTVTAPRRFSLYHLPVDELEAVLEGLDAQEGDLGDLGQNRHVWDAQVTRLRLHAERLRSEGDRSHAGEPVVLRARAGAGDDAGAVAGAWADDRGVHVLDIGSSEQILAITPDPADVLGMDLRPLIGGHLTALVHALTSQFGDMVSTDLRYLSGGLEDRSMVFERASTRTELRAVQGPGDPDRAEVTSRWHLAARTTEMDAVVSP